MVLYLSCINVYTCPVLLDEHSQQAQHCAAVLGLGTLQSSQLQSIE
jgi:hypothetical protein